MLVLGTSLTFLFLVGRFKSLWRDCGDLHYHSCCAGVAWSRLERKTSLRGFPCSGECRGPLECAKNTTKKVVFFCCCFLPWNAFCKRLGSFESMLFTTVNKPRRPTLGWLVVASSLSCHFKHHFQIAVLCIVSRFFIAFTVRNALALPELEHKHHLNFIITIFICFKSLLLICAVLGFFGNRNGYS